MNFFLVLFFHCYRWAFPSGAESSNDLVCTRRNDHSSTKITVSDHQSGLKAAVLIKYGLILLAVLFFPILFFKIFILPFKILVGLKAISLLNSLLLGSLLLKQKFSKFGALNGLANGSGGVGMPGALGVLGSPAASSSSSASAASNNLELLRYDLTKNQTPNFNSKSLVFSSDDPSDYVDVIRPGEDLKRLLKLVKKKNRNW